LYGDWRAFHVSRIEDKGAQSCKRLVTMGVPDEATDDRGYKQVRHRSRDNAPQFVQHEHPDGKAAT